MGQARIESSPHPPVLAWLSNLSPSLWLTAVVLADDMGHFVHNGDRRAYPLRGGVLSQLRDDHSLTG